MSGIDELLPENFVQDGKFKVTQVGWTSVVYFLPYFKTPNHWHGVNNRLHHALYNISKNDWSIFVEPEKTIKFQAWFHADSTHHRQIMMYKEGTKMRDGWVKIPGMYVEV